MTILVFLILVPVLALVLLGLNLLFAPNKPDAEKISTYETGFDPVGSPRSQFSILFYLVGILFLIFDLELTLFYPLSISLNLVSSYGFILGITFIIILTVGFVYEYGSGVVSFSKLADRLRKMDKS